MTATPDPVYTRFLPAIEDALREDWSSHLDSAPEALRHMVSYHMGWEDNATTRGKRIRPALVLTVVDACGKDWYKAMPAAVAVEWLHNFSLIHDDIQDQSELRHGRETLWKRWGVPQAINTGDTVFTLSFLSLANLGKDIRMGSSRSWFQRCQVPVCGSPRVSTWICYLKIRRKYPRRSIYEWSVGKPLPCWDVA